MKIVVFCALAVPAARLTWLFASGGLGPLPFDNILISTGAWSMRLLVAGLAITPLRGLLAWRDLIRLRRMVGLFAAFYALLHVLAYAANWSFGWGYILGEVVARTYLAVGALAAIALVPLALTANDLSMRWLGGKRWRQIHHVTYALTTAALLHFMLSGRLGEGEPLILAAFLGWAFSYRIFARRQKRARGAGTLTVGQQLLLGGVWTVLTLCFELAYFGYAPTIDATTILQAYVQPAAGLRPSMWVGAAAALVTIAQLRRQRRTIPAKYSCSVERP